MAGAATSSSRMGLTLQGYDQVIALSQANINESLEYNFTKNKHLCKFDESIAELGSSMKGTLKPPTIRLIDQDNADRALFSISFRKGKYSSKDGDLSLSDWVLAFDVNFSLNKMNRIPERIRKELVEVPGAYSAEQLIIDFGTATFSLEETSSPGLDLHKKGQDLMYVDQFVNSYLVQLRAPGSHNVLGYAVKVNQSVAGQSNNDLLKRVSAEAPSFPPTSLRLQTINHRPEGRKESSSSDNDHNAFLFTEMTEFRTLPDKDLAWSGDWFYESIGGTLALSRRIFWDRFLTERLKVANRETLEVANEVAKYLSGIFEGRVGWFLSDDKPGDSDLNWNGGQTPNMGRSFDWQRSKEHSYTNEIPWRPDMIWKLTVESAIATSVDPVIGEGKVIVRHKVKLKTDLNERTDGYMFKFVENRSILTNASVNWTTELQFRAVASGGGLSVEARTLAPTITCENKTSVDSIANSIPLMSESLQKIVEGNHEEYKTKIKNSMARLTPWGGIAEKIQAALDGQGRFIFPGGGTFDMKDPIFSSAGDLLIGLTYRKGQDPVQ